MMQIVLVRHGVAEDRETFQGPDAERSLTGKGERRTREAAAGLRSLLPELAVVGTSPYVRARQTAKIIAAVYAESGRRPELETVDAMQPGGEPAAVSDWLGRLGGAEHVALVGHEPDLSGLMAWLTTGESDDYARFKKAGACLIECPATPGRGEGELQWLMTPAALRRLAG